MKYACPKCGKDMARNGVTPNGRPRWVCRLTMGGHSTFCYTTTTPGKAYVMTQSGNKKQGQRAQKHRRKLKGAQRFIITAAQNATPVHKGFMAALITACQKMNAELLIVPIRYKNPTSRWTESQTNAEEWAPETTPYLFNVRKKLGKNLVLMGDVKTQPTASSPLTGFDALTHGESGILAHTKLQLRTVPTPQNRMAKILTTTGACTVPNYTDSKAGALGAFHHTLGACVAEIDGGRFHLRQINANTETGAFTDLDKNYSADGVSNAERAKALIMGDTHVDFIDPAVEQATFGAGGIAAVLDPALLVWHDLLDNYAVNPHHIGNPFNAIAKQRTGRDDAYQEVSRALQFLQKHTVSGRNSIVVPSNHNDFLTRWIMGTDWRSAPINAEFYLETALAMARGTKLDGSGVYYPDPFAYWGAKLGVAEIKFLHRDESFTVSGIELGMHGDKGPNGARGSIRNLRRIGIRSVVGHTHSPGIDEGCYQVGTSTRLRLEYTSGPSGWLNTHCVVYASGKRALLSVVDGKWRV